MRLDWLEARIPPAAVTALAAAAMLAIEPLMPMPGLARSRVAVLIGAALLGLAIALSSPVGLLLALATAVYLNRFQVAPEERALLQRFGSEYERYRRSVRRWRSSRAGQCTALPSASDLRLLLRRALGAEQVGP